MVSSNVLKILFVLEMLKRTDEQHPINSTQIIDELKKLGLDAQRKSIGNYIRILREELDYDIILCDNKNLGWYMVGQDFEEYELKMLVDAVNSAKFLTADKTRELRNKILSFATKEGKRVIKSAMVMDESLKITDKMFDIKFDAVMRAIADNRQIKFQYQELVSNNQIKLKNDGKYYQITPYYMGVWGHEYFVVANTLGHDNVSFYRIEMMKNIETVNENARPMSEVDELKDIGKKGRTFGDFIKENINLRNGIVKSVKISGINKLQREVTKKFGNKISFKSMDSEHFTVNVNVADSAGLYQWIAQYGSNMRIEAPEECIEEFKKFLTDTLKQYM